MSFWWCNHSLRIGSNNSFIAFVVHWLVVWFGCWTTPYQVHIVQLPTYLYVFLHHSLWLGPVYRYSILWLLLVSSTYVINTIYCPAQWSNIEIRCSVNTGDVVLLHRIILSVATVGCKYMYIMVGSTELPIVVRSTKFNNMF